MIYDLFESVHADDLEQVGWAADKDFAGPRLVKIDYEKVNERLNAETRARIENGKKKSEGESCASYLNRIGAC